MEIQSLSICVPAACPNRCKFCVAHMHRQDYLDKFCVEDAYSKQLSDLRKRLMFARDNGCNTVVLTGDGEPLSNMRFLRFFGMVNSKMPAPFRWIELQTSGVLLDGDRLQSLREDVEVNTISLSLSSVFDDGQNFEYNGTPQSLRRADFIQNTCREIIDADFNLRLSLNMTDVYDHVVPELIFERLKQLRANQVTFRMLYGGDLDTHEGWWIRQHSASREVMERLRRFVLQKGRALEVLPFGATRYSVDGISTVVDDDCMSTEVKPTLRYLILRPNCRLYSKWDDKGSLIF